MKIAPSLAGKSRNVAVLMSTCHSKRDWLLVIQQGTGYLLYKRVLTPCKQYISDHMSCTKGQATSNIKQHNDIFIE